MMENRNALHLYEIKEGKALVGIKGRYHCTPRWYKIRLNTRGVRYVLWRCRQEYLSDMIDEREAE